MHDSDYYWHKLLAGPTSRSNGLHTEQIKEVYRNSSKIADLIYIQGYGEFLLDKNDNLIKVQKEQDNEL